MVRQTQLQLEFVCYQPFGLSHLVERECGGGERCDQVSYLDAYLLGVGIKTLVVERPYIDRHYMEEYGRYYALSFQQPRSTTTRVHAFTRVLDQDLFHEMISMAANGSDARVRQQQALQQDYRGFIVLRPLPAAPIGRTALAPLRDLVARIFRCDPTQRVHLAGFELSVRAAPFQQQEQAVGACATTALWTALAVTARATGRRGPTPYEVTEGATRHVQTDRQLPAQSGLNLEQVVSAVQACGFAPYVMKATESYETFSHALKCYLASGIPVVLLVHEKGGYHAVTAVGFRSPDEEHDAPEFVFEHSVAKIRTTGFTRVYVHEDRLGPYARMDWRSPSAGEDTPKLVHLRFKSSQYRYDDQPMHVYAAVVPLYPKLRLTARGLLSVAAELHPLLKRMFQENDLERLRVDLRFVLSGDYLSELLDQGGECKAAIAHLVRSIVLPRYVGIVRFELGGTTIGDVVCDSTDIFRDHPGFGSVLALVPLHPSAETTFENFFQAHIVRT